MAARHYGPIDIGRIYLYEENPRHEPIETQPEIIKHLCRDEQVYNLARSISEAGVNPLEALGLVEIRSTGTSSAKNYEAWEGNRRVCAIKLLNDPDLAPADLRADFARLARAETYVAIKKINCVIFDDHDDLKFWMGIIHNGAQAGIGRSDWDSAQKARHFGSNRNRVALAVLDAAEAMKFISKEQRAGKLTTAQRFLGSSVVREALGIDVSNPDDVAYNRPLPELTKQLGRFVADLKRGAKVTSRHNRDQIDAYGRQLARRPDISGERIQPLSLKTIGAPATQKSKKSARPKKPRKRDRLEYDKDLARALENIGNDKLESLHFSICSVPLEANTPLLTIGVWAFVESLSALAGKNPETDFLAFFSPHKLGEFGFGSNKKTGPIRDALQRIQRNGNATKHHEVSASFHGRQLANDLETITPVLMKTLQTIGS